jgi:hypothetical protein
MVARESCEMGMVGEEKCMTMPINWLCVPHTHGKERASEPSAKAVQKGSEIGGGGVY